MVDIETCGEFGVGVKVVACIKDPVVVRKIFDHLEQRTNSTHPLPHPARRRD
jgi:hypothetical protein